MEKTLKHKIAVYGTLLKGFKNHYILNNYIIEGKAKYIGNTITKDLFLMFDLGYYPGISKEPKHHIYIEIYEVNDQALKSIRWLEGHSIDNNGLYKEEIIDTEYGKSIIYIYNNSYNMSSIIEADTNNIVYWSKHLQL